MYKVIVTAPALERIREQATYISVEQGAPEAAALWLQRVLAASNSLSEMPKRCSRAIEDAYCAYEVRSIGVEGFLLLFTITEDTKTVWVIGARHGRQLPRAEGMSEPGEA